MPYSPDNNDNPSKETEAQRKAREQFAQNVKDQAAQIWQAGLGAFAKAQEEGSKFFDSLVKDGAGLQKKTQAAAEEKFSEATAKMQIMASEVSARATGQWDKLEGIFETRVSKAMAHMGAPTAADIAALSARIDELNAKLDALGNSTVSPARAAAPTPQKTKTPVKKAAAKTLTNAAVRRTNANSPKKQFT